MSSGIECMVMRGGSSKGIYVLADALADEPDQRDDLLRRVLGSPDPRQIDGIGGAHPLTSKVAVVGPTTDERADVEYLFLQVGVDTDVVTDRQNCGNLLAGVAPFAIERGLVRVDPDATELAVRILMQNTDSVAVAHLPVRNGLPVYDGDTAISGVPGTGATITLEFDDISGSSCGSLLPSGNVVDSIEGVSCTLIDNGMPVAVIDAAELAIAGDETCDALEANAALRKQLEAIRLKAGHMMNLGDVSETTVPKLTIVSAPRGGGDLTTRTFIPHRCHEAIGVLGAVSVATAALVHGTTAHRATQSGAAQHNVSQKDGGHVVRLEHPTGHFDAIVQVEQHDGRTHVVRAGIVRTARKIMDGTVFPRAED